MSIKSQKSLNDECSEIFEKGYSLSDRSASEESLSCGEDESLARELMNKMTPAVLNKLRRAFKKNKERNKSRDIERKVEEVMRQAAAEEGIEFAAHAPHAEDTLWLDEKAFVDALDAIFGHHKYTTHAHKLFQLLDSFCTGKVWWRQLIDRLVAVGVKKTRSRADVWKPAKEEGVKRLEHCKRETIIKLVSLEREDSFCYVAVSRGGRIGVYSGELVLVHSYEVFYHRTGLRKRIKNCWITDAIYLHDVQNLVLSASDRSLTIYDTSTLTHTPVFCISGLPNIPTCLSYSPSSPTNEGSELAFGTERGDITRVRFHQPRMSLFHSKSPEAINYYFWMELTSPPHTTYCGITTWRRVHSRSVRRLSYTRDGDILVSCSHDSTVSVRSRHVPGKLTDYTFKVQRGVSCFHIITPLHLLVTGSVDGVVRFWETTQASPFAALAAPTCPAVLDVAVIPQEEIVVAYCNNCTVHIWDMYEECLLQSIKLHFPFLGVLGKKVDFGAFSIHPGPARKRLSQCESRAESPLEPISRRGSSVYQGSTGGLMLQPEPEDDWQTRELEQEP
nr:uncharacterized protein LOC128680682 [Plodia interpunctella]